LTLLEDGVSSFAFNESLVISILISPRLFFQSSNSQTFCLPKGYADTAKLL